MCRPARRQAPCQHAAVSQRPPHYRTVYDDVGRQSMQRMLSICLRRSGRPPVKQPAVCRAHACSAPQPAWQINPGAHYVSDVFQRRDGYPVYLRICNANSSVSNGARVSAIGPTTLWFTAVAISNRPAGIFAWCPTCR